MKKAKPAATAAALFPVSATVPSAELARVPDHAERFAVPVSARTILELEKIHNGYGAEHMRQAARGLDREARICYVDRAWLKATDRYLQQGGAGGMQLRLRACYRDFRAYCVKVAQEDAQR